MKDSPGFTLVEVAIAVAILGLAMTTLIGLQSRFVANYVKERELTRAILVSQYLMTAIEIADQDPELGITDQDLIGALEAAGYFDLEVSREEKERLSGWMVTQEVSQVDIHELEDVLRRIDLTIRWGDDDTTAHKLSYFIKTRKRQS